MNRINVVGTSGSGKSTFGRRLAARLGVPYIEMDALYWKPDWTGSSPEAFLAALEHSLARPAWVLDGNYHRTIPVKWASVDTVIWLDYSFPRTLYQAVKRAVMRARSKTEIWPGTGNVETFRRAFLSHNSIVLWTVTSFGRNRRRYRAAMARPEFSHIRFVRLTSPKQAQAFLAQCEAAPRDPDRTPCR